MYACISLSLSLSLPLSLSFSLSLLLQYSRVIIVRLCMMRSSERGEEAGTRRGRDGVEVMQRRKVNTDKL